MYLHLGGDVVISHADIVGIFDIDTSTLSKHTREMLAKSEKEKRVVTVSDELPKSFIAAADGRIYISQISSATLKKRVANKKI